MLNEFLTIITCQLLDKASICLRILRDLFRGLHMYTFIDVNTHAHTKKKDYKCHKFHMCQLRKLYSKVKKKDN